MKTHVRSPLVLLLPAFAVGVLLCAGCSEIYVRRMFTPPLTESWRSSVITCCELSPRSQQTLDQYVNTLVAFCKTPDVFTVGWPSRSVTAWPALGGGV